MLNSDEKEFEKFVEEYQGHAHVRKIPLTPQFKKMAEEYRRGIPVNKLMRDYGVRSHGQFYRIVAEASKG